MADKKVNVKRKYKSAKGVLRAVKLLFEESPSNWTTMMSFRRRKTANGGFAFCAAGAINHFSADGITRTKARNLLQANLPNGIEAVNDRHGRKAILAGLEKALA